MAGWQRIQGARRRPETVDGGFGASATWPVVCSDASANAAREVRELAAPLDVVQQLDSGDSQPRWPIRTMRLAAILAPGPAVSIAVPVTVTGIGATAGTVV
jgi:hypothetical protein